MGAEGDRPSRPTQTVRNTCSGKIRIVTILRNIRSDMYTASATNSKLFYGRKMPPHGQRGPVLKHNGRSGTVKDLHG